MKSLVLAAVSLFSVSAMASLTVQPSHSEVPVIPASAVSCLSLKQAGTNMPVADINSAYFRIPRITITKKDSTTTAVIAMIKVKMPIPGRANYQCALGGDALSALSDDRNWWSAKDAVIPAGTASLTTNCPMYCGNVPVEMSFRTTAVMQVYGYESVDGSDKQTPTRAEATFTVIND